MVYDENIGAAGHRGANNSRRPLSNIANTVSANANDGQIVKPEDAPAGATSTRAQAAALAEAIIPNVAPRALRPAAAAERNIPAVSRTLRPRDPNTGHVVTRTENLQPQRTRAPRTARPSGPSTSTILQARSDSSARPRRRSGSAGAVAMDTEPSVAPVLRTVSSPLPDIDSQDKDNYLCETEYVQDIYSYYRAVEDLFTTQHYMDKQPDINDKMRAILIDWLVEVHLKFRLMPETLFLTVQIIDRYLDMDRVSRKNLQLVGVTSMLIASKYEEIWAPEVRDFVFICDSAYTKDEILAMEKTILNRLEFKVTSPTSYHFLARFIKACASRDASGVRVPTEKRFNMLCMYAVEIAFPEYDMMGHSYSKISAASVLLARQTLCTGPWTRALEKHTGYKQSEIQDMADKMRALMIKAASNGTTLKAVHKKYSNARFHSVTQLVS